MWGRRNRLIHGYGNTYDRVVFDVVAGDLPALAETIAQHLAEQESTAQSLVPPHPTYRI